jgi:hypothetical protein
MTIRDAMNEQSKGGRAGKRYKGSNRSRFKVFYLFFRIKEDEWRQILCNDELLELFKRVRRRKIFVNKFFDVTIRLLRYRIGYERKAVSVLYVFTLPDWGCSAAVTEIKMPRSLSAQGLRLLVGTARFELATP